MSVSLWPALPGTLLGWGGGLELTSAASRKASEVVHETQGLPVQRAVTRPALPQQVNSCPPPSLPSPYFLEG
jgi:hypothetical protein